MKLIEINWKPDAKTCRQFGFLCLVLLPIIGWSFRGWHGPRTLDATDLRVIGVLGGIGLVAAIVGLIQPLWLRPVYVGMSLLALPIGLVVGEITMGLIFFVVFLPVSMIFRLIGRDPLSRGLDRSTKTYWTPKAQPRGAASYFRQS